MMNSMLLIKIILQLFFLNFENEDNWKSYLSSNEHFYSELLIHCDTRTESALKVFLVLLKMNYFL